MALTTRSKRCPKGGVLLWETFMGIRVYTTETAGTGYRRVYQASCDCCGRHHIRGKVRHE